MSSPTIDELLDLQREIQREVDEGGYVIDVEELQHPNGLHSDVSTEPLHIRIIEM
jgi:hypothetical protein